MADKAKPLALLVLVLWLALITFAGWRADADRRESDEVRLVAEVAHKQQLDEALKKSIGAQASSRVRLMKELDSVRVEIGLIRGELVKLRTELKAMKDECSQPRVSYYGDAQVVEWRGFKP